MNTRAVFFTSSVLLVTGMTSANAADIYAPSGGSLKDPVISEQIVIPDATIYEEHAEWFIRGDVGVGRPNSPSGSGVAEGVPFAVDDLDFDTSFSGSVGFGRYVTPHVRLGVDLEYRDISKSTFNGGEVLSNVPELTNLGAVPLEMTSTSIMFSAIYDFAPSRRFSPYVGGGIGWTFNNLDFKHNTYTNDLDGDGNLETGTLSVNETKSNHFAANVVTGVSINVREGLFLDVGYKFSYLGAAELDFDYTHPGPLVDPDPTITLDDIMTHEFRVGLRYDLY